MKNGGGLALPGGNQMAVGTSFYMSRALSLGAYQLHDTFDELYFVKTYYMCGEFDGAEYGQQ
jgi:hypothetical protein